MFAVELVIYLDNCFIYFEMFGVLLFKQTSEIELGSAELAFNCIFLKWNAHWCSYLSCEINIRP